MLANFDFRHNAIGALRLFFAAAVVVSHTYTAGGFGEDFIFNWSSGRESLGNIAVAGFFVLSGFLITRSAERTGVGRFFWHRFLRIFPAFWVCLIVVAFCVAPIVAVIEQRPLLSFLFPASDSPFRYLIVNADLTMRQYGIAGLLHNVPFKDAFDGSLWTLRFEFGCYAATAFLAVFGILETRRSLFVIGLALLYVAYGVPIAFHGYLQPPWSFEALQHGNNRLGAELIVYFFAGSGGYLFRDKLPLNAAIGLGAIVAVFAALPFSAYSLVLPIALPAATLWLAAALPLYDVDRRIDLSYGLYIYASPLQQLAAAADLQSFGILAFLVAPLVGALGLAYCSWFLVELPAMRLKNTSPANWRDFAAIVRRTRP